MECGKLTAKLRDAVPVFFIEEGREVKRVKNIDIPDEIKHLEFIDFKFDVPMAGGGAVTFKIIFAPGTLPEEWPASRKEKAKTEMVELAYNVTGEQRKALVAAVAEYTKCKAEYLGVPSYAFRIGKYTISREGTLSGRYDEKLIVALANAGFNHV